MPTAPPTGPEIIILRDDDTGEYKVRLAFPAPDGEFYTITMSGDLALLIGDNIRFAALSCLSATMPNTRFQS